MIKICDRCNCEVDSERKLKRIKGIKFCKSCYKENRLKFRKETIENSGIKDELRILDNKIKRGYNSSSYKKKSKKILLENVPKMKGAKDRTKKKQQSSSYLTLEEKQNLFRILINRGFEYDAAKDRIKELIESQKELRTSMLKQNKSEEEIKKEQINLMDGLLN